MSKQEAQRIRNTLWQARWQKCQTSGLTMAQYARREGFDAQAAYRWRHLSGLKGRRVDAKFVEPSKALTIAKPRACAVFARVAVSDAGVVARALVLRLVLNNGRRAELEIDGAAQLGEVIAVLERTA